jgi:GT2 family glycosyltransferase
LSTNAPPTRATVTAIIVSHDGAHFLPDLVRALRAQTHPIEQIVGVDTASEDDSQAVLAGLIGQDAVVSAERTTGFGAAVAAGLRHATRRRQAGSGHTGSGHTGPGAARAEWIWLLHDDCEPAPDALEELLRAAARDRAVMVVGPKVLDARDRRTLREVGISIDRAGRRVTGIDPGEIDQGQHDHKRSALAVSSAGMLVRREAWERLGGFDENLAFFRDDVDFCWRVQAAGLRVNVATEAVLYHWELASRRRRDVAGGSARVVDQRNALFVLAVNLPLAVMLRIVGGCVLGSLGRALYFLLAKQLDLSAAYALSALGLFAHPLQLLAARRRRAAGLAEGYYAVRIFIPPARTLAKLAEEIAWLASSRPSGRHLVTAGEPGEDAKVADQAPVARRVIGHPGVQLLLVLLAITLIATRRLLGTSPLGGGALVPAWGGALALWHEYLAGFHAVSVGSAAAAPPYLAVVAALATLLGGQAWLAVDVLLLGCVPLAGMTAYLATRPVVAAAPARVLLAAAYALLPVATGAVAAGRLGTATAFILLPLIAVSAGRAVTAAPRQARRAAWATGLLIAVAAAFAPLTWVLGVLLAVAAVGVRRWKVVIDPLNAAIVAVTPFFVLFPWSLHLLASPSALLSEAGLSPPGLTTHGLTPAALLALSPGGPGVPPYWVTAGFALALVALALPARRPAVLVGGWAVAVTGLLAAVLLSRVTVTPPSGGQPAAGWPGVATALAGLGLLLASAPAAEWLATVTQNASGTLPSVTSGPGRGRRKRRLLAGAALAALAGLATVPLFVAASWVTDGVRGPVRSISGQLLPTFVSASSASGARYRTLVLRPDGAGLDYQVVRRGDPSLGEPELGVPAAAQAALSRQVAALGAPDGADAGDPGLVLGSFGIKWVMLPAPVDPVLASRLDASVGLVALNKGPSYDLWQVTGPVGQVRVVSRSGATTIAASATGGMSDVTAPAGGGTLILAEPDGGWTARLNGQALKPVATPVGGWAQGFVLPPGGGQLSITYNGLPRLLSLILELAATLAVVVLALPGRRVEPAGEAGALVALREAKAGPSARRAAGPGAVADRPRAGAGHRAVNRELSGADLLPADEPGLDGQRRAGRARVAEGAPGRHRGTPGDGDGSASGTRAGSGAAGHDGDGDVTADGTGVAGGTGGAAGTGALPAVAPWETGSDWDGPGPAHAHEPGQQPPTRGPAAPAPAREPARWGTGALDMPGEAAAGGRGQDDADWLEELLRKNASGQQPAVAPVTPEPARWGTGPLDLAASSAAGSGRGEGQGPEPAAPAAPEGARPEAPPWETQPADMPGRLPGAEPPDDDPAPRRTPSWKGALARLTGQQPVLADGPKAQEPPTGPVRPPAAPERREEADWLDELLRKNEAGQPFPVTGTGAQPPAGNPSAWSTGARSAWEDGPQRAARTGAQPAARTGPRPTFTPTGPQPSFTPTGGQPAFIPSGPEPVIPPGPRPSFTPAGAQPPAPPAGPATPAGPAPPAGPAAPAWAAPASPAGELPAEAQAPPADKPPWESGAWDTAANWDAAPAAQDPGGAYQASDGTRPPGALVAEPGAAAAKQERHARRGGKHGKPSRWRGPGGRSGGNPSSGNGES